ncbi:arginyl-tRNA synthetase [Breznakia sp. PF5-3]|uniref:arginine--tRNA ligase n=1 Tax=unclassified Breznakia TaxID=2623764 RepID=UPI002404E18E|nr:MULTISPECIES: arginine--tRNA ligase [unclassified Breznakia]MDF9824312.1 arginyl-tRNA synthetase [Breznakia sp. PM6-1]MDF9835097.1 arginyl-tRNA synthetase [Breznakia sp. PF5-3]MDF9838469.1 arginyl-tRNA synthetase [Breznakia sp. PFB2-8]MDF9860527.1 arginyl-tRNA synthetase [Breznakia sp. PH5-24]
MSSIDMKLKEAIADSFKNAFDLEIASEDVVIEIPKDKSHGDYATNAAMKFSKQVGKAPRDIAQMIIDTIDKDKASIDNMEIAGPGFINFTMKNDMLTNIISVVLEKDDQYGKNNIGNGLKVNCEYVSANPTGDLHLGHARGAAWGDSVTRLMKASGYDVTREYYINDAGNQIINLGKSLYARYAAVFGKEVALPDDGYHGDDVKAIAENIAKEVGDIYLEMNDQTLEFFKSEGIKFEMDKLKKDLKNFRVEFDVYSSEQAIRDAGKVEKAIETLSSLGMTYEKDDALWFETTKFNDDKDRVLRKSDGSYTYLVPDIAYHINKLDRGFDKMVDFLGADHHGYVPRLKASIEALGRDSNMLEVDIIQMVRLVENGEEIKMSKRLGNAITLRDLCNEVGVDAARYFFVQRALDTHFDFDISLAKKENNENPVYYAQYAHARICSILKASDIDQQADNYELLTHEKEVQLLKYINEFTNVVGDAAKNRAPNKVCNYIQKLASLFHSFYGSCKVNDPENQVLSAQRMDLLKACKITLKNALYLIGVEAPEQM